MITILNEEAQPCRALRGWINYIYNTVCNNQLVKCMDQLYLQYGLQQSISKMYI